jgi:hypothetical protein
MKTDTIDPKYFHGEGEGWMEEQKSYTPLDACPNCNDTICQPASLVRDNLCWMRDRAEKAEAEVKRLKTLMHQTIWFVDDMIKTHANGCEHCFKKHGAMIALFKDITEEPQWPINQTSK